MLSTAPDVAVYEATRFVATLTRNFSGARRIAQLLTDPGRSPEVRGMFHILAAFLSLAGGRRTAARRELSEAAQLQPAAALEYRALFATLPFLPGDQAELRTLRSTLEAWDPVAVPRSTHPYPAFDMHREIHVVLRLYLLGTVSARLGDAAALSHSADLDRITGSPDAEALARDLAHSVRAYHAFWRGDPGSALEALQQARVEPRQILIVLQSPFYTEVAERWLRAELLQRLGRYDEAKRWYESLVQASLYDLICLAPSHLRRAEICERFGERNQAAEHCRRVVELWHDCDPELRPVVTEATAQLERLQRAGRERGAGDRLRIV
jgi:tetratricopeptide (TPR) repeat protein